MAKRESKKVVKAVTTEQYNDAMSIYAAKEARMGLLTSKMDVEINKIRDKYKEELDTLSTEKEDAREIVQTYCEEHPELFSKARSIDTVFGKVGFRTGTPKLKLAKGSTWAKVLDNLKSYLPNYVRTLEEPAKDRLLVDRELPEVKEGMSKAGVYVDKDENFFIDLKTEETATA